MSDFVHLHNHSHYSLLDGLQKVPEMLDRVQQLGMSAAALTDHGTLSGAIEFYKEAHKRGLKPIIGIEAYVAPRTLADKAGKIDADPYHLILLAQNNTGYQNLMRLSTIANLDGFYYKPRVDRELLAKYHEGIIALSACASGEVGRHILNGDMNQAAETVQWYQQTFGKDNYYLEIQDHDSGDQKRINNAVFELSKSTGAPVVLTADCHYAHHEDKEAHEILLCVQTGKTIDEPDRMSLVEFDLHLKSAEEMAKRWQDRPEVLANTVKIAERCEVELQLDQLLLPTFPVPDQRSPKDYLHELAYQGLAWRYGGIAKEDISRITKDKAIKLVAAEAAQRLDYELGVIAKMGFDSYFLIVADFINWGKNRGIIFGPGRGSAAGSIVAYALNVTDLDPIKYDLLFERFLNPDRISMPDIDIDIQDTRRGEVIDYVVEKYGQDRVAQIVTFGTMASRAAVRDTGRALGMPYGEVDVIAKLVPPPVQGRHIPLATTIKDDPDLKKEYSGNPRAKRLIDLAMRLEGTIRSNGVHAAGVVIAPDEIVKWTPLARAQKGGIATQYSMGPIEELGLLKMDFLGLSNLSIIKNALRIIKKVHHQNIELADLPLDDPKTYALLARGDTTGIFQFESSGMKRYMKDLKPTEFEDIIAMGAIYRPGPLSAGLADQYIERKNGRQKVTYEHPNMETALKPTYGVLVYQEQVMRIARDLCGFSGAQADTLRRAIGKKKPKELAKMKAEFIDGAIKVSQVSREFGEKFWKQLEGFADYAFNKSHSACYGMISFQTAYLKAHYPSAFMAALLTSDYGNIDRIGIEVAECRRMGLEVLPPDVNSSFLEFGVVPDSNQIRFGLSAIKNIGFGAIEAILKVRDADGPFVSVEDFARRVPADEVNKKVWESLIKAGAFDSLGERGQLLFNIDSLSAYAAKVQKNALSGQIDIFGSLGQADTAPALHLETPPQPPAQRESLAWEKELLGLYLSSHPLDDFEAALAAQVTPIAELKTKREGNTVKIGGLITTVRRITTKSQQAMAFVGIEDKTGVTELVVFPRAYADTPDLWQPDTVVKITGKVNTKDREGRPTGEIKVLVDQAASLSPAAGPAPVVGTETVAGRLVISLSDLSNTQLLLGIKDLLTNHRGSSEVFIKLAGPDPKTLKLPFQVQPTPELVAELQGLDGITAAEVVTPAATT